MVALTMMAFTAGCGSGRSSTQSNTSASTPDASAEFVHQGGKKENIVQFGSPASTTEREAANVVLQKSLKARASADFATQCATLDQKTLEEVSETIGSKKNPAVVCPRALKELAEPFPISKGIRTDTLDRPIPAMRVKGNSGYALYHGTGNEDYAMKMKKEHGEWKVASLLTIPLGTTSGPGGQANTTNAGDKKSKTS
ncbi:MAG: hypothetical protein JST59_21055 [Actinobacteria bacterium]|nr:hypothetical protein [Actinomycetota bacterium]